MPDRHREVVITTPTHPMALAVYAVMILSGVLNTINVQTTEVFSQTLNFVAYNVWALAVLASGILALWGAWIASRTRWKPETPLVIEAIGCVGIFGTRAIHEALFYSVYGFAGLETQVYLIAIIAGAIWRAFQIRNQVLHIRHQRATLRAEPPSSARRDED